MKQKFKTPIKCPGCGSSGVRRRELVHKSGTSIYYGRSSTRGVSFSLFGRARPRAWFGGGTHYGKRQSIRAQEAEPLSYWPPIIIATIIFIFPGPTHSFGFWSWAGFIFCGMWVKSAYLDRSRYQLEWLCSKCGAVFIPDSEESYDAK